MTDPQDQNRKAVHLHITGKVQGVFYRNWMTGEANRHNLDGWVRNLADGSVEALVAGPATLVDALIRDCWEGPPAAEVDDVVTKPAADPGPGGFTRASGG